MSIPTRTDQLSVTDSNQDGLSQRHKDTYVSSVCTRLRRYIPLKSAITKDLLKDAFAELELNSLPKKVEGLSKIRDLISRSLTYDIRLQKNLLEVAYVAQRFLNDDYGEKTLQR